MTPAAPFPCNPGDKLRVTKDHPYSTDLVTGDIVTVESVRIRTEGAAVLPVVIVSTAYGRQILGYDAVEPYDLPAYVPAEKDDVVDAFFFGILGADDDLRAWAVEARETLSANDPASETDTGGGTATATVEEEGPNPRSVQIGGGFEHTDGDGDHLLVTYRERHCEGHGREGGFFIRVNGNAVLVPATEIDGLLRFLFGMKKHSERPD